MARSVLTDLIWAQLQRTMKSQGCHHWKNDREIMEAILWKLRTGAPWRDLPNALHTRRSDTSCDAWISPETLRRASGVTTFLIRRP